MTEIAMIGTKEVAGRLKIKPRYLRAMLRKINGKAPGERYEWKPTDRFLKKLPELIKAEEKKAEVAQGEKSRQDKLGTCPHRTLDAGFVFSLRTGYARGAVVSARFPRPDQPTHT